MSSAAKLRKFGRGTATIATAALVMTSFGPAAFAWTAPDSPAAKAGDAGALSWGLVDTDRSADDTQGATAVVANAQGQNVADIRLVVPAAYLKGDYIDIDLPTNSDPAKRVLWTTAPSVDVSGPYASNTHVGADSGTTVVAGETEETGQLTAFTPASGQTKPEKPSVTSTLITNANGSHRIRLTFNTLADSSQKAAKFVLTLSGLKVDVGSGVAAGNVEATAKAFNADGSAGPAFWGDAVSGADVTIPAYVSQVGLSADTTSLTSDGTVQVLGPVTVAATKGNTFTTGSAVTFQVTGANVAASPDAKVTFYDAGNSPIGSPVAATVVTGANGTASANAPAGATRAVFSGVAVTSPSNPGAVTLTLTAGGGFTPPTSPLTAAGTENQTDIAAPGTARATIAVNPVVNRLGGADRYETAVKIAQAYAAKHLGANDEVDNLVIASGESFPDALSAGYLANTKDAPIVLTQKNQMPQIVSEFIRNRGVKNVYIVGGEGAVSGAVERRLAETRAFDWTTGGDLVAMNANLQVVRIAGSDRFDTNRAVNEYAAARTTTPVGTTVPSYGSAGRKTAIVVNGMTPWDALAAGPMVAGAQNLASGSGALPIVLTAGDSLAGTAKRQFQTLDITHAIFVGGYGVLPLTLEREAAAFGTTAGRLGGENRWQTAEAVGNFLLKSGAVSSTATNPGFDFAIVDRKPLLANGGVPSANAWADALAAGPLAAKDTTIIALTAATSLPADTKDLLVANRAVLDPVIALGLGGAVSTEVVGAANQAVAD